MTPGEPEVVLDGTGPIHRRIYEQIRDLICNGTLQPGEQLPTVRAAAVDLGVNPNAVALAYAELAAAGLVTDQDGSGTFVAGPPDSNCSSPAPLAAMAGDYLARAAELGFTAEDALRAVQALHERSQQP